MRLFVDFDNEVDGDRVVLSKEDVSLPINGVQIAPESIEGGQLAIYELPDDLDMEAFDAALEGLSFCHYGYGNERTEGPSPE